MSRLSQQIILILLCLNCIFYLSANAQDSSRIRVSLLTCTPGEELYSIFGHSAIRIIDSNSVNDYVFNYGTFNFYEKDFYIKFMRGKLLYYLSIERFDDFRYSYQMEGRGMTEQVLNLSQKEKEQIYHDLIENVREENKYYRYDFFLDNCTTRLRDLIVRNKQPLPVLPAIMPTDATFRQAIQSYLDRGRQYWSKLGIDILLGARTDRIMTPAEQQFLPDNLMSSLDKSQQVKMVTTSENLYEIPKSDKYDTAITPLLVFTFILILIGLLSLLKNKTALMFMEFFDRILFFSAGALGILLILMWVATDHSMTKNNYNLLWAVPSHLIACFFINKKTSLTKNYFLANTILCGLLLISWFFLPQKLNIALIPIVLVMTIRSYIRFRSNSQH